MYILEKSRCRMCLPGWFEVMIIVLQDCMRDRDDRICFRCRSYVSQTLNCNDDHRDARSHSSHSRTYHD